MTNDDNNFSHIKVHLGETLVRLANFYPSLPLTLVEGAQNAIDADADRIMLCIDLQQRTVVMADNGEGTSVDKFQQALFSVGKGIKSKDKLGRFGLGLISPLTKCTKFTFISAPPHRRTANRWTFAVKDISVQRDGVTIPRDAIPLPRLNRKFLPYATDEFACEWRTMVNMVGVTKDKVTSLVDLDDLESQIHGKLGQGMRRNKTQIRVVLIDERGKVQTRDITSVNYTGESLGVVAYEDDAAGRVEFELYRAPKRGGDRKGRVSIMASGDNYPITMTEFVRQARGRKMADLLGEAMKVLSSGYFEGTIRCENIELAPERTKFVYTDALESLYLIIDQWYEEYGQVHFRSEQEQSRETRWQDIALKSCDRLRAELDRTDFSRIWDGFMSVVEYGRLGEGHLNPESGRPDGPDDETTLRTGQGGVGVPKSPGTSSGSGGGSGTSAGPREPKDRPGDVPMGARGPGGQRRRLVKGDSKGLWFGFEEMPLSSSVWDFDRRLGVLIINTRSGVWMKLDETNGKHFAKNAKWTQQFLEWLSLEVLTLLHHYPDEDAFELNRSILDNKITLHARMFIAPDAFK